MSIALLIPLVGQLITLAFKVADIIDKAEDIDPADKAALRAKILEAKNSVSFWE